MSESFTAPGTLLPEMEAVRAAEAVKKNKLPEQPSAAQSDNNSTGDKAPQSILKKISSLFNH